jgi:hypothetical protein
MTLNSTFIEQGHSSTNFLLTTGGILAYSIS